MTTPQSVGTDPDFPGTAAFYGFVDSPFLLAPDPRVFFESEPHRTILDAARQSLTRRRPFTLLTGAHGSGKTIVCRALIERLDRRIFSTYVPAPPSSFEALLQTVLVNVGVVSTEAAAAGRLGDQSMYRLLGVLHDFLLALLSVGAGAVLIVDEAQHVSDELLEQLRVLSNLEADDAALLPIVLAGRPDLLERFGDDESRALDPRISCVELLPLTRADVEAYITHRLTEAQPRTTPMFHRRAIDTIYEISAGSPRVVNQLCGRALAIGAEQQSAIVSAGIVDQAAVLVGLSPGSSDGSRWSWRRLVATRPAT